MKIGIQGGPGSFNEEAILSYLQRNRITNYELKYLYTTENVLKDVVTGKVHYGQFAIHNSLGGLVSESLDAMARHTFKIEKQYQILISHCIMAHPSASLSDIDAIQAHPQVFKQCRGNLSNMITNNHNIELRIGDGEAIDHSFVAAQVSNGKMPRNIGTMGSRALAKSHSLKILRENMQDSNENYTRFLLVSST